MWPGGGLWSGFHRVVAAPNPPLACTRSARLAIMPLGDSITYGTSSTTGDGYRAPLATLLNQTSPMGTGWLYEGSQESGSLFWSHEGHGGWTIDGLTNNITGWLGHPANTGEPIDLVLLDAGTNDDGLGHTSQQMLASMSRLLDKLLATTPTIRVVVAQITITLYNTPAQQQAERDYDNGLPTLAASKDANRVKVVDMRGVQLSSDNVHPNIKQAATPNDPGYTDMAQR